jgi:hypothetical protein
VVNGSRTLRIVYYGSLLVMTLGFGALLGIPVSIPGPGHGIAAFVFPIAGVVHFITIITRDRGARKAELAVLLLGIPFFLLSAFMAIYQTVTRMPWPPYVFFSVEVISLSIATLFTPIHVFTAQPTKSSLGLSQRRLDELERAFRAFDRDGSGFVSQKELAESLEATGVDVSDPAVVRETLAAWDVDGDGRISFAEFVEVQKSVLLEYGQVTFPIAGPPGPGLQVVAIGGAAGPVAGARKPETARSRAWWRWSSPQRMV